jgi:hypothetical protein
LDREGREKQIIRHRGERRLHQKMNLLIENYPKMIGIDRKPLTKVKAMRGFSLYPGIKMELPATRFTRLTLQPIHERSPKASRPVSVIRVQIVNV